MITQLRAIVSGATVSRATVALLSCFIAASGAWAASDDAALYTPDAQMSPLPGFTVSPFMAQDSAVVPASAETAELSGTAASPTASAAAGQNSSGCCDDGSSCMDCCTPLWNVSLGEVILHRNRPSDGAIVGVLPSGSPAFSRGSDFDPGWDAGPEITIARRIGCDNAVEVRYFNCYGGASTQFVTPSAFIGAGFTGPGGTLFVGHDFTKLDSFEINCRHQAWDQLVLLAGFRALDLRDDLSYKINSTVATGEYFYDNHMYGGQLGADWALMRPDNPLQFGVMLKAGVYGNADHGGITQIVGNTPVQSFLGQGATAAFVGEFDFLASYNFTDHIAVHGGYQLLWLTNLALSPDAASRSLVNPALLRTVSDDGRLFYNGATVGVDFMW
jgi:hypothetical protein